MPRDFDIIIFQKIHVDYKCYYFYIYKNIYFNNNKTYLTLNIKNKWKEYKDNDIN